MKKTTKNIIIGVAVIIVGLIVLRSGFELYNFRIDGGYRNFEDMGIWLYALIGFLTATGEVLLSIIGAVGIVFGGMTIFNNAKKLMR